MGGDIGRHLGADRARRCQRPERQEGHVAARSARPLHFRYPTGGGDLCRPARRSADDCRQPGPGRRDRVLGQPGAADEPECRHFPGSHPRHPCRVVVRNGQHPGFVGQISDSDSGTQPDDRPRFHRHRLCHELYRHRRHNYAQWFLGCGGRPDHGRPARRIGADEPTGSARWIDTGSWFYHYDRRQRHFPGRRDAGDGSPAARPSQSHNQWGRRDAKLGRHHLRGRGDQLWRYRGFDESAKPNQCDRPRGLHHRQRWRSNRGQRH